MTDLSERDRSLIDMGVTEGFCLSIRLLREWAQEHEVTDPIAATVALHLACGLEVGRASPAQQRGMN